jgi:hypothetical protein
LDFNKENALEFNSGTFIKGPNQDIRVGLTLYNNAFAADSISNTDNAEAFLHDLAEWAAKEFNFVVEKSAILRTTYFSTMEVQFNTEIHLVNPRLNFLPSALAAQAVQIDGKPLRYALGGIRAWGENAGSAGALQPFLLERKWGTPFDENVYSAQAPLRTKEHVTMLEAIENALR